MASDLENGRPNIRIEFKNTPAEAMDIDENEKSEEEGEIKDTVGGERKFLFDKQSAIENPNNIKDGLRTVLDTFKELDTKKLEERAKRFSLKPEEINSFTELELHSLYASLGITSDNADQIRFEAIHIRSNLINVESVTAYFMEYSPTIIEWVDSESFNIIWDDKFSSARTLFHISQAVRGMPVRDASEHVIDNFITDESDLSKDVNLLSENRQIELRHDCLEEFNKFTPKNSVDISDINIPIPPGYWRLGKKPLNSFSVLLRFSLKTDKKPYQSEKYSKYFRNMFSNKMSEQKNRGIFSRNKDICTEQLDKNPWGILAKNWDEDVMFRERDRYAHIEPIEDVLPIPVPENPELRVRLAAKRRLGIKETQQESKKTSISEEELNGDSEQENEQKKVKMPRMRMYADEEEEKIKRKKLLQNLKKQTEKLKKTEIPNSDLRNILRITNKKSKVNVQPIEDLDLSLNLRNRKLLFTVSQESVSRSRPEKRQIRDRLDKPPIRPISPLKDKKPKSPIRFQQNASYENYNRWARKDHYRERERRRSPVRKRERRRSVDRKYEGRMYSSRIDTDNNYHVQKPKSKVALVIKTQKKPSVASAIQSRRQKFDTSSSSSSEEDSSSEDSESSDDSEDSSSSSSEDSVSGSSGKEKRRMGSRRLRVPIKVEIKNDQYKRK